MVQCFTVNAFSFHSFFFKFCPLRHDFRAKKPFGRVVMSAACSGAAEPTSSSQQCFTTMADADHKHVQGQQTLAVHEETPGELKRKCDLCDLRAICAGSVQQLEVVSWLTKALMQEPSSPANWSLRY